MAKCLAESFPDLQFIVQIDEIQFAPPGQDIPWHSEAVDLDSLNSRDRQMDSDPAQRNIGSPGTSCGSCANLSVTYRSTGMPQHMKDAAVYILHLPAVSPGSSSAGSTVTLKRELQSYLNLLRINRSVLLVPTTRFLPNTGGPCDPKVEAVARARDLYMLQLVNQGEMELVEVLSIIEAVKDNVGKLIVTSQLRSPNNNLVVALVVKHLAT